MNKKKWLQIYILCYIYDLYTHIWSISVNNLLAKAVFGKCQCIRTTTRIIANYAGQHKAIDHSMYVSFNPYKTMVVFNLFY